MNGLRGILLDLDGTIADSIDFFYGLTCQVLDEAGLERPTRSAAIEAIALGLPPATRFLPADFPDRDAFIERLYRERWADWRERYGAEIEPLPGACAAVEALHRRGLRLGLVTSSSGELPFLERWNIRRFFSAIVCREDVARLKPHPEPLLSSLARLGLEPNDVVNVGDTPLDVRAGHAAGIRTVGVLSGAGTAEQLRAEGASAVLSSIAELPDFLDRPVW